MTIDGIKYKVLGSLGYVQSIGGYAKEVEREGKPAIVVKQGGAWRFWRAIDKIAPGGRGEGQ